MTSETSTTPAPTVWPGLTYVDAPAALRLSTEVFGFTATLVVPGSGDGVTAPGPEDIVHAELRWPEGGAVMLGSAKFASESHPEMRTGGSSMYVVTDDPDAVYARVKAAGLELVEDLHDTDYGSHTFTTRDPEGNLWTFGTYRGA